MTNIVDTETVFDGFSRLIIATIALPDGQRIKREIEDHGRAVCVLPYDPERRTAILVRQFRAPAALADGREHLLEAVAGSVEDEAPDECAHRAGMPRRRTFLPPGHPGPIALVTMPSGVAISAPSIDSAASRLYDNAD